MNDPRHDGTSPGNQQQAPPSTTGTTGPGAHEKAPAGTQALVDGDQDFGQTLQDLVLDSPDVEEFLAEFTTVAAT